MQLVGWALHTEVFFTSQPLSIYPAKEKKTKDWYACLAFDERLSQIVKKYLVLVNCQSGVPLILLAFSNLC